jgi:hypothetical protein
MGHSIEGSIHHGVLYHDVPDSRTAQKSITLDSLLPICVGDLTQAPILFASLDTLIRVSQTGAVRCAILALTHIHGLHANSG